MKFLNVKLKQISSKHCQRRVQSSEELLHCWDHQKIPPSQLGTTGGTTTTVHKIEANGLQKHPGQPKLYEVVCAPVHVYLSFCAKWFQHPRCFHKWWDSSTLFCNQLDPNVVSHNPKSKTYWHFNDEKPPEAYVAWVVVAGFPAQSPLNHESHLGLLRWISMQGNTALDGPVLSGTSDNQHHALGEENPPQWCWPTQWVLCTVGRLEQPSCANQWSWFD